MTTAMVTRFKFAFLQRLNGRVLALQSGDERLVLRESDLLELEERERKSPSDYILYVSEMSGGPALGGY